MAQARAALERHETEEAQGILINLIVGEPRNEEAWILLADTFDDVERRMECMQRARQANPSSARIASKIQEIKTQVAGEMFGAPTAAAPAPTPTETPAANAALAQILLDAANVLAQATVMATDIVATREVGFELAHLVERASSYDAIVTRRWTNSAGRAALTKYEKALTQLLTNMPQNDPQIAGLREQRQRALDLFK